ncbi:riboflavin synthase [bacterium]|jgi:riboflavin synthase|nr:riboflavin synthase [bacterium]MBT7311393.1 riboflavin synthase [bacterium]
MFTGLVREIGSIVAIKKQSKGAQLSITAPDSVGELALGDSLAANGICLTITSIRGNIVNVDAVDETVQITTLKTWRSGKKIHLEPALKAGDPMGGHIVLGHVDGVGKLVSKQQSGSGLALKFQAPDFVANYLLPKGSIAIDGVSLTLDANPDGNQFSVNIIPHTLSETLLADLRVGDAVNLEADVLAKRKNTEPELKSGLTVDKILAHGFMRKGKR